MTKWTKRSGIQLAYPFEEKRLAKWTPPWIIQPKLDGERCRAIFDEFGKVELLSSEENEIVSVPHIQDELESLHLRNVELDGELYIHGLTLPEIHSIVSRRTNLHEEFSSMEYWVFDIIEENILQKVRTTNLGILNREYLSNLSHVHYVPFYIVSSSEEIYNALHLFTEEQGFEGFILRHTEALYTRKRSIHMMKFKPKRSDIYTIVGFNEAIDQYGVPKNTLGAFLCQSPPKPETFPVGAGRLTHEERKAIWKMKDLVLGNKLLVEYQHLTKLNSVPRSGVAVEVIYDH